MDTTTTQQWYSHHFLEKALKARKGDFQACADILTRCYDIDEHYFKDLKAVYCDPNLDLTWAESMEDKRWESLVNDKNADHSKIHKDIEDYINKWGKKSGYFVRMLRYPNLRYDDFVKAAKFCGYKDFWIAKSFIKYEKARKIMGNQKFSEDRKMKEWLSIFRGPNYTGEYETTVCLKMCQWYEEQVRIAVMVKEYENTTYEI